MNYIRTPLHEVVDPEHTLPEVDFVTRERLPKCIDLYDERYPPAVPISNLFLLGQKEELLVRAKTTFDLENEAMMFEGVGLVDAPFGKGYGMQMYLYAINNAHEMGYPFRSSWIFFSSSAKRVWEKLIDLGIAEIEGTSFTSIYDEDEWTADIYVRPR